MRFFLTCLKLIKNACTAWENNRQTYVNKNESELRDHLLSVLASIFGGSVLAESKQGDGKTDIIVIDKFQTNLRFTAECKWWSGTKGFDDAITQLKSYTPSRFKETCLIIFSKNKNFRSVIVEAEDHIGRSDQNVKRINDSSNFNAYDLKFTYDDRGYETKCYLLFFDLYSLKYLDKPNSSSDS